LRRKIVRARGIEVAATTGWILADRYVSFAQDDRVAGWRPHRKGDIGKHAPLRKAVEVDLEYTARMRWIGGAAPELLAIDGHQRIIRRRQAKVTSRLQILSIERFGGGTGPWRFRWRCRRLRLRGHSAGFFRRCGDRRVRFKRFLGGERHLGSRGFFRFRHETGGRRFSGSFRRSKRFRGGIGWARIKRLGAGTESRTNCATRQRDEHCDG
jgi:hypothetical protein